MASARRVRLPRVTSAHTLAPRAISSGVQPPSGPTRMVALDGFSPTSPTDTTFAAADGSTSINPQRGEPVAHRAARAPPRMCTARARPARRRGRTASPTTPKCVASVLAGDLVAATQEVTSLRVVTMGLMASTPIITASRTTSSILSPLRTACASVTSTLTSACASRRPCTRTCTPAFVAVSTTASNSPPRPLKTRTAAPACQSKHADKVLRLFVRQIDDVPIPLSLRRIESCVHAAII